jgi:peptide/nickel transport system permease protein
VMVPILILETVFGIVAAMAVAYVRGSLTDRSIMIITTVMLSISFLVYIIVGQWLFGFYLGWFPVQGWSDSFWTNLTHYAVLPVLLAVFVSLAPNTRLYRSFFLDEINQDYVRTARAKGVTENRALFVHVLRNAMIPVLTNVAVQLPGIFLGSFLIETFFSIPGLGRETLLAVNRSDYPVIQAVTVYLAALTMVINLGADILYKGDGVAAADERQGRHGVAGDRGWLPRADPGSSAGAHRPRLAEGGWRARRAADVRWPARADVRDRPDR